MALGPWSRLSIAGALALALLGCGQSGPAFVGAKGPGMAARSHSVGQIEVFALPEAGSTPVVTAIDAAEKAVWIQVYMLTDPAVMDALGRAAERGLDVRVLLEDNPAQPGGTRINQETARLLAERGVRIGWTDPRFVYTHAKTMLIDGNVAYVLTYNLTRAGADGNREFGVINRSPSDVEALRRLFIADWNRVPYRPLDPDLVISPDNARLRILGLMARAQRELLVGMEVLSDAEAVALIASKHRAGVTVRVLVGGVKKVPANLPPALEMAGAGVAVRSQSKPYLHAKYIVADGQAAYVGSINLTTNSLENNREIGLLLKDAAAIDTLRTVFDQDWQGADPIAPPPVEQPLPAPLPEPPSEPLPPPEPVTEARR